MAGPFIEDEEHENTAGAISNVLEDMYTLLSEFINYLNSLSAEKIIIGNAGSVLKAYANQAANLRNAIPAIDMFHAQACQHFLIDIRTADHEL